MSTISTIIAVATGVITLALVGYAFFLKSMDKKNDAMEAFQYAIIAIVGGAVIIILTEIGIREKEGKHGRAPIPVEMRTV